MKNRSTKFESGRDKTLFSLMISFWFLFTICHPFSFCVIHRHHFSLALLCYPNKLAEYIRDKRIVNGVDYFKGSIEPTQSDSTNDKLVSFWFSLLMNIALHLDSGLAWIVFFQWSRCDSIISLRVSSRFHSYSLCSYRYSTSPDLSRSFTTTKLRGLRMLCVGVCSSDLKQHGWSKSCWKCAIG